MKFSKKIMTMALLTLTAGCASTQASQEPPMTPRIYTFESDANGFNTKSFFYDNGQEVVAFDTQFTPATAQKAIEFLRQKTVNPITYVVISHPNPDKFNGISVFKELGAKVIASESTVRDMQGTHDYKKYFFVSMAKMFTEESYPQLSLPDSIFSKSFILRLKNGEPIELTELSHPGVSTTQTVAMIPAVNALIVGDLVHYKAHAWLEGGIVNGKPVPTLKGWIADLNELSVNYEELNPEVYGGRGETAKLNDAVRAQVDYLTKADAIVVKYVKSLGTRKKELIGQKANHHHQALQAEFEKAFPDHALPYMIQYGVYGLANSKL